MTDELLNKKENFVTITARTGTNVQQDFYSFQRNFHVSAVVTPYANYLNIKINCDT